MLQAVQKKPGYSDSDATPQPLSRLKARYTDETSPTKSTNPLSSSPDPLSLRTPSLVQIAKDHREQEDDMLVSRLRIQYGSLVPDYYIRMIIKRHGGNTDRAINEIAWMANKNKAASRANGSPPQTTKPAAKISKPKKNEQSRIYANRSKSTSKKRDPDDSESEAEAVSDVESANSWSGDEGRAKKKRKQNVEEEEEEVDAEGAALRAFNTADVGMLTGTIGGSASFLPVDG